MLYHFDGKDDLIDQVVREVYAAGSSVVEPALPEGRSAAESLRAYLEASVAFVRDHPKSIRALGEILAGARSSDGVHRYASPASQPLATTERILHVGRQTGCSERSPRC